MTRGSERIGGANLYVKFITIFVVLAVALILVISYFSFSRAVIEIKPRLSSVTTDFIADIETQSETVAEGKLKGFLFNTEVSINDSFDATGTKDAEGNVIGQVKLINDREVGQPLIATTRLLTADGVLLRIKNRVDVPAKGSVMADVYADNPSAFETLAPSKFTIPGLATDLQKVVYAESAATLKSKPGSIKVMKSVDLAMAKDAVANKIYTEAINRFNTEVGKDFVAVIVDKKLVDEKVSAKVDDMVDTFTVEQKINVTLIGLKNDQIMSASSTRLKQLVSGERDLRSIKMENLTYVVQNYNAETKTANVKIHAEGETSLKADSKILDKSKLAGLSTRGVELYLSSFDEIETVKVTLSPFFVTKVPSLADHVSIIITE